MSERYSPSNVIQPILLFCFETQTFCRTSVVSGRVRERNEISTFVRFERKKRFSKIVSYVSVSFKIKYFSPDSLCRRSRISRVRKKNGWRKIEPLRRFGRLEIKSDLNDFSKKFHNQQGLANKWRTSSTRFRRAHRFTLVPRPVYPFTRLTL